MTYTEEPDGGHGRIDCRTTEVYHIDPIEAGLPGARTLIVVRRSNAAKDEAEPQLAYYHASESITEVRTARYFAGLVRGHWGGCEIRNHWVRDAQMFEDKTRIRNYNINANLATLRCCLLKIKAQLLPDHPWPQIRERAQADHAFAYQLIANQRVK